MNTTHSAAPVAVSRFKGFSQRCRQLIRLSYFEGFFYALMVGMAESFALFHAVQKGLSIEKIALLSTVPILLGSLSQWIAPRFVKTQSLRHIKLMFYAFQIVGLAGLVLSTQVENFFGILFASLALYWIGGMSCGPLWLEWMAAHIPRISFRMFMSKRNAFVALATLLAYGATAFFLDENPTELRFAGVFAMGTLARLASLFTQAYLSHPKLQNFKVDRSSRKESAGKGIPHPVLWMMGFTVAFKFFVSVSSPFFLPYMIQTLDYGLLKYVSLTAIPYMGRFLFLTGWGRASRDLRPFVGIQLACLGISMVPALWATTTDFRLLCVYELCSGVMWGGFELCTILVIQKFLPRQTLSTVGLHLSLMNTANVLGSLIGAQILQKGVSYPSLFMISSSLRFTTALAMVCTFLYLPETRFRFRVFGEYLVTVLSLRPSFANIGRVLVPNRVSNRNSKQKRMIFKL